MVENNNILLNLLEYFLLCYHNCDLLFVLMIDDLVIRNQNKEHLELLYLNN